VPNVDNVANKLRGRGIAVEIEATHLEYR
jgi:hypothetical protein